LEVFGQKYDFCTSGRMNARLSVHCSLKRALDRIKPSCTLAARLSVQPDYNIFEKNSSCGPECRLMLFFANFYNVNKASMSRN